MPLPHERNLFTYFGGHLETNPAGLPSGGANFGDTLSLASASALNTDLFAVQEMVQRVRGFCYATDALNRVVLEPTNAQCTDANDLNRAHVGGLVHSSVAVIGGSPYITDLGAPRPTIA